jgi:hypothetical protein
MEPVIAAHAAPVEVPVEAIADPEMTLASTAPFVVPAPVHEIHPSPEAEPEAAESAAPVEGEEVPYSAASRLGGLRNLLVSLGVKNLHKESEFRNAPEADVTFERLPERPVFAQPDTPETDNGRANTAPALVKAQPEIIPPRLAPVESIEREKDSARAVKSPQVSRWDSPEDVDTLPSRRGQYRKRR